MEHFHRLEIQASDLNFPRSSGLSLSVCEVLMLICVKGTGLQVFDASSWSEGLGVSDGFRR